jgi:hypothetical protein
VPLLEDHLQGCEVVVDSALDRDPCELRHDCRDPVELDLGVE